MENVSRTKNCKSCGNINFKIVQKSGSAEVYCSECKNYEGNCIYDRYETIENSCYKCGEKKFKMKIIVEDFKEYCKLICNNCETEPKIIYIDKDNNEITKEKKETLIIDEKIEKMEIEIDDLTNDNEELKVKISELEWAVGKLQEQVAELESVVY